MITASSTFRQLRDRIAKLQWPLELGLVVAIALVVRLCYLKLFASSYVPFSDADQYVDIARHVARGDGIAMQWPSLEVHPTAFRPPVWPAVLGLWVWIGGDGIGWMQSLNIILGCISVAVLYLAARSIGGRRCAVATSVVFALYLPLLANDVTTLSETLASLICIGLLWSLFCQRFAVAGVLATLLALTKPTGVLVFAAIGVAVLGVQLIENRRAGFRKALRGTAVFCAVGVLVLLPWSIRNHREVGTWSLTTSTGFNLAAIYAPPAVEARAFVDPVYAPEYQDPASALDRLNEGAWNESLMEKGREGLRQYPGYSWVVVKRNLASWFELDPSSNAEAELFDGRDPRLATSTVLAFFGVTVVGLAGWFVIGLRSRRLIRLTIFSAVLAGVVTATSLLFVAAPRLRSPFDLCMCIGCGLFFAQRPSDSVEGAPVVSKRSFAV